MDAPQSLKNPTDRWLEIREVRLVSDLRIMHARVDDLYHIVNSLQHHHDEEDIYKYADAPILAEDIQKVEKIYMWFIALKEEMGRNKHP
jgi:hypothetical protein